MVIIAVVWDYELWLVRLVQLGVVTVGKQSRVCVAMFLLLRTRVVTHPGTSSNGRYLLSVT